MASWNCRSAPASWRNLAVGAALYLTDAGKPLPAKLLLAYPFLHVELFAPAGGQPVLDFLAKELASAKP